MSAVRVPGITITIHLAGDELRSLVELLPPPAATGSVQPVQIERAVTLPANARAPVPNAVDAESEDERTVRRGRICHQAMVLVSRSLGAAFDVAYPPHG